MGRMMTAQFRTSNTMTKNTPKSTRPDTTAAAVLVAAAVALSSGCCSCRNVCSTASVVTRMPADGCVGAWMWGVEGPPVPRPRVWGGGGGRHIVVPGEWRGDKGRDTFAVANGIPRGQRFRWCGGGGILLRGGTPPPSGGADFSEALKAPKKRSGLNRLAPTALEKLFSSAEGPKKDLAESLNGGGGGGGWSLLAVGGGWQLVAVGGWRLVIPWGGP